MFDYQKTIQKLTTDVYAILFYQFYFLTYLLVINYFECNYINLMIFYFVLNEVSLYMEEHYLFLIYPETIF